MMFDTEVLDHFNFLTTIAWAVNFQKCRSRLCIRGSFPQTIHGNSYGYISHASLPTNRRLLRI